MVVYLEFQVVFKLTKYKSSLLC